MHPQHISGNQPATLTPTGMVLQNTSLPNMQTIYTEKTLESYIMNRIESIDARNVDPTNLG
jgi:hypothetical protein